MKRILVYSGLILMTVVIGLVCSMDWKNARKTTIAEKYNVQLSLLKAEYEGQMKYWAPIYTLADSAGDTVKMKELTNIMHNVEALYQHKQDSIWNQFVKEMTDK